MGDVVISGAALTVFTGLLGSVSLVVGVLFRAYDAALHQQRTDLEEDRNYWRSLALKSLQVSDKSAAVLERLAERGLMVRWWAWFVGWRLPVPVSPLSEKAAAAQQLRDLDRRLRLLDARAAGLPPRPGDEG